MKQTKLALPRRVKIAGKTFWLVTAPAPGGGRIRKTFKEKDDARIFHEQAKAQITRFGSQAMELNDRLRAQAVDGAKKLEPFGATIADAVAHYLAHLQAREGGVTLAQAAKELLSARKTEGASTSYIQTLRCRLNRFVDAFPKEKTTRELSTADIDSFLAGLNAAPATGNTYRRDIRTLFSFSEGRGWVAGNPADRASRFMAKGNAIKILTPQETASLVSSCDDTILPAVVLSAFCPVRASEVARLDWQAIDLDEMILTIDASIAKTASRRVIAIPQNAVDWLRPLASKEGSVMPADFRRLFDRARVRAGFTPSFAGRADEELQALLADADKLKPWPSNCLRHGAISYSLAVSRDIGRTATAAGNSPAVIARHYLELVKPSAAKAFFAISPNTPANEIAFKVQAA